MKNSFFLITILIITFATAISSAQDFIPDDLKEIMIDIELPNEGEDIKLFDDYKELTFNEYHISAGLKVDVKVRIYNEGFYLMMDKKYPSEFFDMFYIDVYNELPAELKKYTKGVRFIISHNYDLHGYIFNKDFMVIEINEDNFYSGYSSIPNEKNLFMENLLNSVLHESGHLYDFNNEKISSSQDWIDAVNTDKEVFYKYFETLYGKERADNIRKSYPNGLVSLYAERKFDENNNYIEDFAESIKLYFSTDNFKEKFPARSNIIKKLLLN